MAGIQVLEESPAVQETEWGLEPRHADKSIPSGILKAVPNTCPRTGNFNWKQSAMQVAIRMPTTSTPGIVLAWEIKAVTCKQRIKSELKFLEESESETSTINTTMPETQPNS